MCVSDHPRQRATARPQALHWRSAGACIALTAALWALAGPVQAADKDQEQVRRLKLQMRQLQQTQGALQEAQTKADADRQQAEKALQRTSAELQSQRAAAGVQARRAATLSQELAALKDERTRLTEQVQQLTGQLQASQQAAQAAASTSERTAATLTSEKKDLQARVDQCTARNLSLYKLGADLLTRYENKGMREVLALNDPFFQFARVELENVKSEYQDKLESARLPLQAR